MATPLERLELEERFLSGLLAFVPPSLYLPRTDAELDLLHERSGLNARFWKRSSTEANVKLAMKNKSKKAKRRRYEAVSHSVGASCACQCRRPRERVVACRDDWHALLLCWRSVDAVRGGKGPLISCIFCALPSSSSSRHPPPPHTHTTRSHRSRHSRHSRRREQRGGGYATRFFLSSDLLTTSTAHTPFTTHTHTHTHARTQRYPRFHKTTRNPKPWRNRSHAGLQRKS